MDRLQVMMDVLLIVQLFKQVSPVLLLDNHVYKLQIVEMETLIKEKLVMIQLELL